jgi:predicted thioredoxin/glutaredoxin
MVLTIRIYSCNDCHSCYAYFVALKDKALLESTLSVKAMPRQKASVAIVAGAFFMPVLALKRKTQ